ncbi:MAG: DinB family protein [Planctomycetota bacterium]
MQRPSADEFADYFQPYLDRVPDGDLLAHLERQGAATVATLGAMDEARGAFQYAPGKWSVKSVLQHVADGERMFCYRALCLARGEVNPLPGFDENLYAANDGTDHRTLAEIVREFAAVRAASVSLFAGFDAPSWRRSGVANGHAVSVRSLPWIIAGHELHHLTVLAERYGIA